MTIVTWNQSSNQNRCVFLIGEGLIGAAVIEALIKHTQAEVLREKNKWDAPVEFELQLRKTIEALGNRNVYRIDWIWCAGKSGFQATEQDTFKEWGGFNSFLREVKIFESKYSTIGSYFHLVSSAGGLFEGQRVSSNSLPNPSRPYGRLKLDQENQVKSLFPDRFIIYRPSTVYGYYRKERRSGLISTLLRNVFTNKVTLINGNANTLRDFVWIQDVADFISGKIWLKASHSQTFFLVSGKPTSIFEVVEYVQRISNSKVMYSYDSSLSNAQSIVFDPSLVPVQFKATSLFVGIRKVKGSALCS